MRVGNVISWRGGKSRLAKKIVQFFPPHECYIEPFCGANWVIFNKDPKTSKHEVINDKHEELINFWRVVKYRSKELYQAVYLDIPSRAIHNELRNTDPLQLDEVERARRFYWLTKGSFGGSYADVFGTGRSSPNRLNFDSFKERLEFAFKRLQRVTIECKDYKELPKIYDHETTLWYCDPPYYKTNTSGYEKDFDFVEFVEFAKSLRGKVIISHNYDEDVIRFFHGWHIVDMGQRQNSIANYVRERKAFSNEILILNFDLKV